MPAMKTRKWPIVPASTAILPSLWIPVFWLRYCRTSAGAARNGNRQEEGRIISAPCSDAGPGQGRALVTPVSMMDGVAVGEPGHTGGRAGTLGLGLGGFSGLGCAQLVLAIPPAAAILHLLCLEQRLQRWRQAAFQLLGLLCSRRKVQRCHGGIGDFCCGFRLLADETQPEFLRRLGQTLAGRSGLARSSALAALSDAACCARFSLCSHLRIVRMFQLLQRGTQCFDPFLIVSHALFCMIQFGL